LIDSVIRDWFPVASPDLVLNSAGNTNSGTKIGACWLAYLQVKLRFNLMDIDDPFYAMQAMQDQSHSVASQLSNPVALSRPVAERREKKAIFTAKSNFLGQLEDFF
jgi:hypothetical protein